MDVHQLRREQHSHAALYKDCVNRYLDAAHLGNPYPFWGGYQGTWGNAALIGVIASCSHTTAQHGGDMLPHQILYSVRGFPGLS